ncbi:MAG: hypothetical protein NT141_00375 [candidate division WWE3 bacterium]|nr:hypothetical protein [candidate division WWE3 bacterium]
MDAFFDNFTVGQNDDPVGVSNSRKAVRDNDYRLAFKRLVNAIKYIVFRNGVNRGRRFIKNDDGGVAVEESRNGYLLPLAG